MDGYLKDQLDNSIKDITYDDIKLLYEQNERDAAECEAVTQSSYRGESYYMDDRPGNGKVANPRFALYKEVLFRDPKTAGFIRSYSHGTVITQAERNHYFRGENLIYENSVPTLIRKIRNMSTEDKELYKLVADMRIGEFGCLLSHFKIVHFWKDNYGDILFDALAQHYGLETKWLDITNDFNTALFFATCYYDDAKDCWLPLTKEQTESSESKQHGILFHIPQWQASSTALSALHVKTMGGIQSPSTGRIIPSFEYVFNEILPIGFQPFRRCHMQYGYGIKMEENRPLQQDITFEKLRFRHNEKLSKDIYEMMDQGKKIYPDEGLTEIKDIIESIRTATSFSDEAFEYAFEQTSYFKNKDECLRLLRKTKLFGESIKITGNKHPFSITNDRRNAIDKRYDGFSIEKEYGIKLITRLCVGGAI